MQVKKEKPSIFRRALDNGIIWFCLCTTGRLLAWTVIAIATTFIYYVIAKYNLIDKVVIGSTKGNFVEFLKAFLGIACMFVILVFPGIGGFTMALIAHDVIPNPLNKL